MYATVPAHNLLICSDGLPFCLVRKPACRHLCQLYKGQRILSVYTDNLYFSLGKKHTHTQKPQNPQVKDFRGYSGVFQLATRWCRVPTKMDILLYSSLHYPGHALTARAFIA